MRLLRYLPYIGTLLVVAVFVATVRDLPVHHTEDSADYLSYVNLVETGGSPLDHPRERLSIRTPGYPLVLLAGRVLAAGRVDPVKGAHAAVAVACVLLACVVLAPMVSPGIVMLAAALTLLHAREFFLAVLTEWVAMCYLLLLFAVAAWGARSQSWAAITFAGFVAALAILTRPALLPVAVVPVALGLMLVPHRLAGAVYGIIALAPLWLWMSYSLGRTGERALTPLGSMSLFGIATVVSREAPSAPLGPAAAAFAAKFEELRYPRADGPWKEESIYNRNLWSAAEKVRRDLDLTYADHGRAIGEYGRAVLREHRREHLHFVARQLGAQRRFLEPQDWALLLVLWAGLWQWRRLPRTRPLAFAAALALVVHVAHALLCSFTNVMFYRLFVVTYLPIMFFAFLAAAWLASGWSQRFRPVDEPLVPRPAPKPKRARRPTGPGWSTIPGRRE